MKTPIAIIVALVLAGCATSGGGEKLIPGQSTSADVQTAMGAPKEQITNAAGESVWFYPTAPNGRKTFAVRMRPEGTVVAVEQRLTQEYWGRIAPGATTKDVRDLLGPPSYVSHWQARGVDEWDYRVLHENRLHDLLVEFSSAGVVNKTSLLHDPIYDTPGPP
jgi:hypothetical protein